AMALKGTSRPKQVCAVTASHEREAFAGDKRRRDRLAVQLDQLRLVVEKLELRRPACHEQVDDALRARRKMRLLRRCRVRGATRLDGVGVRTPLIQQRSQRQ